MKIGAGLKFGGYAWRVLDMKDEKALILAEEIIEQRDYHNKSVDITWKDCELRRYLNENFYNQLSKNDQERIVETVNTNPSNLWYKADGGEDTIDKIFLLSIDDVVRKYFGDSSRLLDYPGKNQRYWFQRKDENNMKRKSTFLNCSWWWWLRTPGKNNRVAVYIHGDGNIGIQGNGISKRNTNIIHRLTNDNRGGVRPALWIKM
ncbi:DUF6273 domain-containing protein [Candidatus Galacturonibacter soehngenii]|uniref:DUF6273 domain-containing protein n=1 Tax=Candidatus Galacturonatibacter soehngenii TaxID=2307010 RepID=A0A7V7UGP9_9FIRM|nr:DUF6273 domain-containing protein [Candidatus Galacturonibacter soehngenii]KAB1438686.1 hypothetical protein F7O84_14270 [Candidatus Galacturonibacter soehngenii]MBA4685727.1 hypothetical protein [Candidatus Galacturonibacter soehngenii]